MELTIILKVLFSLIIVIFIMYGTLKLVQRYTRFGVRTKNVHSGLSIEGIIYIDESNKVVSLRRLQTYYLLAINKHKLVLIDKYDVTEQ